MPRKAKAKAHVKSTAMSNHKEDKAKDEEPKATHSQKEDKAPRIHSELEIKGAELTGKNPTRLFQTGPYEKTWLTKEQAENWEVTLADGTKRKSPFYWAD